MAVRTSTQGSGNSGGGADGEIRDIWIRAFDIVRKDTDVPTLWLAMQGVRPAEIQGSYFIATLPPELEYLATNLESAESSYAIEAAIAQVIGRPLAFRLLYGDALAAWTPGQPLPADDQALTVTWNEAPSELTVGSFDGPSYFEGRKVTWEILSDELKALYKSDSLVRYPHGQARVVVQSVQVISDAMDILMPNRVLTGQDTQERQLARVIERFGGQINLDPIFISLELWRYRLSRGKDIGMPRRG